MDDIHGHVGKFTAVLDTELGCIPCEPGWPLLWHSGLGGGHESILATLQFKPTSAQVFDVPDNSQHTFISFFFEEVVNKHGKWQKMAVFP